MKKILSLILLVGWQSVMASSCSYRHGKVSRINGPQENKSVVVVWWGQSNANHPFLWSEFIRLYSATTGRTVISYNASVSATDSFYWAQNHDGIQTNLVNLCARVHPDYVLCIQGEGDGATTAVQYAENMGTVLKAVHAVTSAKCYMALCSYPPNMVGQADPQGGQRLLVQQGLALLGPDVDVYRVVATSVQNGLHFNDEGCTRIAEDWVRILMHN